MLQRLSLGMLLLCAFSGGGLRVAGLATVQAVLHQPAGAGDRSEQPEQNHHLRGTELRPVLRPGGQRPADLRSAVGSTENNGGGRSQRPFARRLWGESDDKQWKVLDANSASDADLWIAYNLLEAGRLWKSRRYQTSGRCCCNASAARKWPTFPAGPDAVAGQSRVRGGRSLAAEPQLPAAAAAGAFCGAERPVARDAPVNQRLWLDTAPHGFSPDWVVWRVGAGWQPDTVKPNVGSYDAIRVYLWAGMLADDDEHKAALLERFQPMAQLTAKQGVPPEKPIPPAAKPPAPARSAFPPRCCRCWRRRPRH